MDPLARCVVACLLLLSTAQSRAASFDVDPAHVSVVFSVSHLGYSYTYGMFRKATGAVEFDKDNLDACEFQFSIDVKSIDTMNEARDEHLLAADFFNAEEFPEITFQSASVSQAESADGKPVFNVTGKLTLHGQTREITLPITYLGEGDDNFGGYRIGFVCQTTIKRSEFGMAGGIPAVGDNVGVTISFEGLRK